MDVVSEAVAGMGEQLALLDKACDELSHRELVGLLAGLAMVARSVPAVEQRALARLIAETEPARLGEASWKKVLTTALRVSGADAAQRVKRAKTLGPRRGLTGQPLPPLWESTAAAQARGVLDAAHVAVIAAFHKRLPSWVDVDTRAHADAQLAELGSGLSPEELTACAEHLRNKIDQDGPQPSEQERARKRSVRFGPQQPDGFSRISGWMSARCRAALEALFAKEAAPGRNIPDADPAPDVASEPAPVPHADDETSDEDRGLDAAAPGPAGPDVADCDAAVPGADKGPAPAEDHDPLPEVCGSDTRTQAQRQHDALEALSYRLLSSGELGSHNGLPVTVIVVPVTPCSALAGIS